MISKIRDNLYLSSYSDITQENINKYAIDHILNVAEELPNIILKGCENTKLSFKDFAEEIKDKDIDASEILIRLLKLGKVVVVHCKVGASRSPHVVALALSKIENIPYKEMYKEIKNIHPRTIPYSIMQEMTDKRIRRN